MRVPLFWDHQLFIAEPGWLLLLPLMICLEWVLKGRLGLRRPLRAAVAILFVLAMSDPRWERQLRGMDLWVLADRSASAETGVEQNLREWIGLLAGGRGSEDRLHVVDFATEPQLREDQDGQKLEIGRQSTRIALAVESVLSRADPKRPSRVLLLTDGFSTEPVDDLARRLAAQGIPLDLRLSATPTGVDFRLASMELPGTVRPGENFIIGLEISGNRDATVAVELKRNGVQIAREEVAVREGRGRLRLQDRAGASGSAFYEARVVPAQPDAFPGNDMASDWLSVEGGGQVLLVSGFESDPVAEALRAGGVEVEVLRVGEALPVGRLTGQKLLILHNVPAEKLPESWMPVIDFAVREQGMGLMMLGGRHSFGTGGYFGSPLAELLPVSLELKEDQRKLSIAMAVVMDRSGSMSVGVGDGRSKMDLANEGTIRAIDLLGGNDELTVIAADSEPHEVFPLLTIAENRGQMIQLAGGVQSEGGGIYVFNALEAAWAALQKSRNATRHIILFSDAADSEEPGEYKRLLAEMRANNTTVSVIALGTESDPDAALLKEIAELGGGRIFFNQSAQEMPTLFAQETVAVARSAFVEEPTGSQIMPGALELVQGRLPFPTLIPGYNLCYPKAEATLAAMTTDEEASPLLAFWQRGAGRVAAITFPFAGPDSPWAASENQDSGPGPLLQTVSAWLAAPDLPQGMVMQTRREGSVLRLDLFHDETRAGDLARKPPELITTDGETRLKPVWERISPGHFQARIELPEGKTIRGAVQLMEGAFSIGPVEGEGGAEWKMDPEKRTLLRAVSQQSGGRELLDFSEAWLAPPKRGDVSFRSGLLVLLALCFLADAFITRWRGAYAA